MKLPEVFAADGTPLLVCEQHKALICFARPQHHNRLEPADLSILLEYLQQVDADNSIRVLILTATGKSFSSGYHLGDLKDNPVTRVGDEPSLFAQLADRLENLRVPTICALNGSVYGGATDLALACDFRLGVHAMRLRMPAARLGLQYYAGGLRRYVSRLGLSAAKQLFLTAATLEAEELLDMGYLNTLCPADELMTQTHRLADTLAANAPLAVCGMKRSLNAIARGEGDDKSMDAAHLHSMMTQDAKEGVKAWYERREPQFNGC